MRAGWPSRSPKALQAGQPSLRPPLGPRYVGKKSPLLTHNTRSVKHRSNDVVRATSVCITAPRTYIIRLMLGVLKVPVAFCWLGCHFRLHNKCMVERHVVSVWWLSYPSDSLQYNLKCRVSHLWSHLKIIHADFPNNVPAFAPLFGLSLT